MSAMGYIKHRKETESAEDSTTEVSPIQASFRNERTQSSALELDDDGETERIEAAAEAGDRGLRCPSDGPSPEPRARD